MSGPKICPHCDQEMDQDLAELFVCSECGCDFDAADLESAEEERKEEHRQERLDAGEDPDEDEHDEGL